jgi:uncharacterized membrane protein YgcG
MAQESNKRLKNDRLKRTLLLGFVFVSVLMIGAIWIDGIVEPEPKTPSYYRDTFEVDDSIYLTVTADSLKYNPEPDGTPDANEHDEHHQGSGQRQGSGQGSGQGGDSGGGSDH